MVPQTDFLEDSKVNPGKLEFFRDSVRFEVTGTIPIESVLSPKNPKVNILLKSSEHSMLFEGLELTKNLAAYSYKKSFVLAYEPWMEGAFLEAQFFQGKKAQAVPYQKKILARGVITTPLLAKIGAVNPDEPIPQVGLFISTGVMDADLSRSKEFLIKFEEGSSTINMNSANMQAIADLKTFLTENSSVVSLKITGTQSPQNSEGKSSKLGMDRSEAVSRLLRESNINLKDSLSEVSSRWNDWFDFRLLLREYEKISTQRKDQYYAILLDGSDYQSQTQALKKIPGFNQVASDLFPNLRAVKIEVVAKPLPGLDQSQSAVLQKALEESTANSGLDLADWAIAGETTPRMEDKAKIYSKMTELFRSVIPYNNLAVVKMRLAQRTLDQDTKDLLWKEANDLLYQAAKIDTNPYVLHNQGHIMVLQGKTWDAYKKLSDASVLTRNQDFLKYNESLRGALDIMRGDYKLATLRFDYPYSEPKDFFNKGLAYFLSKDFANASLSFEQSVMAGRNYGYGFYGLAMIAAESGQTEVALLQLDKAIHASELIYQKALVDPIFEEIRSSDDFFQIFRPSVSINEKEVTII
ncbi:tetratricopeptide repeat protein [Algoriphagus sp. D3-2-R+10]|uniref:tetratricopeptide repeat protein n=1 Tax=Algoriphagus aurantiacus TaxID=3103948 RepID=UPI002B3C00F2|nr:tetratricopeptide repeat protein [Algoriphagus sp. D3-2-R+10]MEB2774503.1 tetratricopeptide repeat protein [Algoriphagus sp. D3-2-R+10]